MATLGQKKFASILRLLQTAYPRDWETHLCHIRNMGVPASADLRPSELDRFKDRVSWMARQTGIKDPDLWIFTNMGRVEAASASVEHEVPKIAPPVEVRQIPVELKPVGLEVDLAKTSGASPPASETGNPAARIATDVASVEAALASVEPEAPPKVALPVAVRQNSVELEPVKLGVDLAKTSGASLLESETAIVIARLLSQAKLAIEAGEKREAAAAMSIAYEQYGARQQKIAPAVGKSQAWVSCMLRWRREGFKDDTPFGPASKDARVRARIGRLLRRRVPRRTIALWMRRTRLAPPPYCSRHQR